MNPQKIINWVITGSPEGDYSSKLIVKDAQKEADKEIQIEWNKNYQPNK